MVWVFFMHSGISFFRRSSAFFVSSSLRHWFSNGLGSGYPEHFRKAGRDFLPMHSKQASSRPFLHSVGQFFMIETPYSPTHSAQPDEKPSAAMQTVMPRTSLACFMQAGISLYSCSQSFMSEALVHSFTLGLWSQ